MGKRLPQYYEFNPDAQIGVSEFNLLVTLIRNSLIAKFPNDANNFIFTNISTSLAAFKDKKYNDVAVQLLMQFGTLTTTGTTIRDQILSDTEIIVTTFYSLLKIATIFDIATGRNIANLLLPIIQNETLYEYDNSIYAKEDLINNIWNVLSGGQPLPTNGQPKSYTRSDGLIITIIPQSDFEEGKLIIKKGSISTEIIGFKEESSVTNPSALTRTQLSTDPNYLQLTTNLLRQLVTQNLGPKEVWQRDIVAGNALELAFRDFKGISRNGLNLNAVVRTKKVKPDFIEMLGIITPPSIRPTHFPNGKFTEVKVIQNIISAGSFNKQILGHLNALSKQTSFTGVKPPPFALSLLLVVTEGTQISNDLIVAANSLKISLFVSYAYLHNSRRTITFSMPESLNNAPGVRLLHFPFSEVPIPWGEADRTWLQSNEYDERE